MGKQEFIDGLRAALNGRISPAQLEDTIDYYRDYINVEVRKGRSEEEVLEMLGDPRLIARTIIQTSGQESAAGSDGADREEFQDPRGRQRVFKIPGWLFAIIALLVFFLLFFVIFSVLSFLAPVLLVMAVVLLMVKVFRDWLN